MESVANATEISPTVSLLTDQDLYLFNEGTHLGLADKLGAHPSPPPAGSKARCSPCGPRTPRASR